MAFYGNGSNITNIPEPAELSTASGSAPSYSCRAWVRKNSGHDGQGNGIMGSGNVSSLTQIATGRWSVNLSTAMSDTNYAVVGTSFRNAGDSFECEDYSQRSTTKFTMILRNYNNGSFDFGFSAAVVR